MLFRSEREKRMRLIDADKIDFGEVFIGASDFAKDTRNTAQKLIDSQPTVNQWIPCSERLPEENGHYLVTYHNKSYGNYLPLFDNVYVRKMRFQNNKWMFPFNLDKEAREDEFQEVIAWQPLPQPYKGE